MNNEFKKIKSSSLTRYVLEDATAGATSAGSIASVAAPLGSIRKRIKKLREKAEAIKVPTAKPRNPIGMGTTQGRGTKKHVTTQRKQSRDDKKVYDEGRHGYDDYGYSLAPGHDEGEPVYSPRHDVMRGRGYSKPKGMYFYNVKPGQEQDASAMGLRLTRSGKWYSSFQNPQADKMFGPGRYWEPKSESVAEDFFNEDREQRLQRMGEMLGSLQRQRGGSFPVPSSIIDKAATAIKNKFDKALFVAKKEGGEIADAAKIISNWGGATPEQKQLAKDHIKDLAGFIASSVAVALAVKGLIGSTPALAAASIPGASETVGHLAKDAILHIAGDYGIEGLAALAGATGVVAIKKALHDVTSTSAGQEWDRMQAQKDKEQGVAEAAKWRDDDKEGKTWRSPDWDDGDLAPSKIGIDRSGRDVDDSGDELRSRPGSWRGKSDMAKRMTKKGVPTKSELAFQNNLKMRIKQQQTQGGLTGPKGVLPEEQGVAEGLVGDVVVHNYTKMPMKLKPGQAQIHGWGANDQPIYRVKGHDGKEVITSNERKMRAVAQGQGVAETPYQGKGNHKPGWMLRADPKLAQKFKEKEKLQRAREKAYGDPSAGKSVGEDTISELKDPSGTMFLKFRVKTLPGDDKMILAYGGFGNSPADVTVANARIKPFAADEASDIIQRIRSILSDKAFVGVEKIALDIPQSLSGPLHDVIDYADRDERLELYTGSDLEPEKDSRSGGKTIGIGPDGKRINREPPKAQVGGSSRGVKQSKPDVTLSPKTAQAQALLKQSGLPRSAAGYKAPHALLQKLQATLGQSKFDMMFNVGGMAEDKIKGVDGKACWKGKRYAGTKNGKDICVPVSEDSYFESLTAKLNNLKK